jgi:hypothetical protein
MTTRQELRPTHTPMHPTAQRDNSPDFALVDFSHLAAWHMASVKGSMGTPETFLGSVGAGNP